MIEEANEVIVELMANEYFLPNIAKLMKKLYDELVKVGFTEEAAALIVANYKAVG